MRDWNGTNNEERRYRRLGGAGRVCRVTEFSELPRMARIERYRALAGDARREAQKATGSLRESYLLMAKGWDDLADALADARDQTTLKRLATKSE